MHDSPDLEHKACILNNLACAHFKNGNYLQAYSLLKKSLGVLPNTSNTENTIKIYINLASLANEIADIKEVESYLNKALDLVSTLDGPKNDFFCAIYDEFGVLYRESVKCSEAIPFFEKALQYAMHNTPQQSLNTPRILDSLGLTYKIAGNYNKASELHNKALELYTKTLESHPNMGISYYGKALVHRSRGEDTTALQYLETCLKIFQKYYPETHPEFAKVYNSICQVYNSQFKHVQGMQMILKSIDIFKKNQLENHPDMAKFYNNLGLVYKGLELNDSAIKSYETGLSILKAIYGDNYPGLAPHYNNLGVIYRRTENFRKALENYLACARILEIAFGEKHPLKAETTFNNALLFGMKQHLDAERKLLQRSNILFKCCFGPTHPFTNKAKMNIQRGAMLAESFSFDIGQPAI